METPIDYYNNPEEHGSSQYVPLTEIIDAMEMEAMNNDSYLKNIARFNLIRHAKTAIRNMNTNVAKEILAFEITVPNTLYITIPQDFVDYVRVSLVTFDSISGGFHLIPLSVNRKIHIADAYLQDDNGEVLFDINGQILTTDASNAYGFPFRRYKVSPICSNSRKSTDLSKFSANGEFIIDQRKGKILFSSDIADKDVVVEYISDGLLSEDQDIKVHKYLKETIENYIYFAAIERLRNVPANEKQRALERYKATLHKAKKKTMGLRLIELLNK